MQTKLTTDQIGKLKQAQNAIFNGFVYSDTDEGFGYWQEVINKLDDKIKHGTNDGKPWVEPEPPLTDQDACVWPRILVMVRDHESKPWLGPYRYQGKSDGSAFPFIADSGLDVDRVWKQARRATPAEIEAAK